MAHGVALWQRSHNGKHQAQCGRHQVLQPEPAHADEHGVCVSCARKPGWSAPSAVWGCYQVLQPEPANADEYGGCTSCQRKPRWSALSEAGSELWGRCGLLWGDHVV
eukprot:1144703-Pelagomonas_calceolata.AAC.2